MRTDSLSLNAVLKKGAESFRVTVTVSSSPVSSREITSVIRSSLYNSIVCLPSSIFRRRQGVLTSRGVLSMIIMASIGSDTMNRFNPNKGPVITRRMIIAG